MVVDVCVGEVGGDFLLLEDVVTGTAVFAVVDCCDCAVVFLRFEEVVLCRLPLPLLPPPLLRRLFFRTFNTNSKINERTKAPPTPMATRTPLLENMESLALPPVLPESSDALAPMAMPRTVPTD